MEGSGSGSGSGSGHRYGGGDGRVEIVSGKFAPRLESPDPPPMNPAHVSRASHSQSSKPWSFNDPEAKRKKRIAKYKVYSVEGKVKASVRKGLRWIKNKCSQIVRGC